jgi:hypothetical protein
MPRLIRTYPTSERSIERLVDGCLDAIEPALGFRPVMHLDWPAGTAVSREVLDAIRDALDVSLVRVAHRRECTGAFVSISWRRDTVEVCVVDDGAPARQAGFGLAHLDAASGVEHDVDHFDEAGICQWWSIPVDLS